MKTSIIVFIILNVVISAINLTITAATLDHAALGWLSAFLAWAILLGSIVLKKEA